MQQLMRYYQETGVLKSLQLFEDWTLTDYKNALHLGVVDQ